MNMGDSIIEMKGSLKQIQLENMLILIILILKIRSELVCEYVIVSQMYKI
jgi:hypothetical protein